MVLDAAVLVCAVNARWIAEWTYVAWTGFPLLFACLAALHACRLLPPSLDAWGGGSARSVVALALCMEALQTTVHALAHGRMRHTALGRSHAVHHRATAPTSEDAFRTGTIDALAQLVVPLVTSLWLVSPSRAAAVAYGCAYSWWLLFLHSSPRVRYPRLESLGLVTPRHHHAHHAAPATHLCVLFRVM